MIEGAIIIGGVGLGLMLLGRRRKPKRPVVIQDPPPPVVEPQRPAQERNAGPSRLERIAALLEKYTSDKPRFGRFVQVRSGQSIFDIVDEAFSEIGRTTHAQRLHYVHCMSSGSYNAGIYGTPSTTKRFGEDLLSPGSGIGLRVAFLPRNEDARHAMTLGRMPKMTVDPRTGEPKTNDRSLGFIWLHLVDENAVQAGELPTCAPYSYPDGSSTIDPPPELLGLLEDSR